MRSAITGLLLIGAVAACDTQVPDSGPGPGFGAGGAGAPPVAPMAEVTASGEPLPLPVAVEGEPLLVEAPTAVEDIGGGDIAAQTAATLAATSPSRTLSAVAGSQTGTAVDPVQPATASGLASPSATPPVQLPAQPAAGDPAIVNYAKSVSHAPGTRVYSRSGVNTASRVARNCARYGSADQAQSAFLGGGGPQQDRFGLDPDGDGFACSWDPSPYRN